MEPKLRNDTKTKPSFVNASPKMTEGGPRGPARAAGKLCPQRQREKTEAEGEGKKAEQGERETRAWCAYVWRTPQFVFFGAGGVIRTLNEASPEIGTNTGMALSSVTGKGDS